MNNSSIHFEKMSFALSEVGKEPILARGHVEELPDEENSVREKTADGPGLLGSGITAEQADGPAAAAAGLSFGAPSATSALKNVRGASNAREAIMKGTAGAIEGLGAPGRFLQGGIKKYDDIPTSIPGSVDRLRDSYGLGKGQEYYENLARQSRADMPGDEWLRKNFGENAEFQGSAGLDISAPGKSDIDVEMGASSPEEAKKKFDEIVDQHPNLTSNYNKNRSQNIASGQVDGREVDFMTDHRSILDERSNMREAFRKSKSDEEKGRMIDIKDRLHYNSDSLFSQKGDYYRWKKELDQNNDIPRL